MKIELEEPFKSLWLNGYLVINSQNRRNVCLVNNRQDRTTISYARYLMCVKIGYILSDEYEVDHVDDDKTNDDIGNFQILTKQQNIEKEQRRLSLLVTKTFQCNCGNLFTLRDRDVNMKIKAGNKKFYCSRECSNKYKEYNITGLINYPKQIPDEDKNTIKKLRQSGLTGKEISLKTGFNRNTVMKYW